MIQKLHLRLIGLGVLLVGVVNITYADESVIHAIASATYTDESVIYASASGKLRCMRKADRARKLATNLRKKKENRCRSRYGNPGSSFMTKKQKRCVSEAWDEYNDDYSRIDNTERDCKAAAG